MATEYKFVLKIMVKDVTCNDIVHSVSIMTRSIFCEKIIASKLGGII